jgi:hypothetical protein
MLGLSVVLIALAAEPKAFPILGLGCADGAPLSVDLMASLGRGSQARVVQWTVSKDLVRNSITRRIVDPQAGPAATFKSDLSLSEWDRVVHQLDHPPEPSNEALAKWGNGQVQVVRTKRCRGARDERLVLRIEKVVTRANARLLAAALAILSAVEPDVPALDGGAQVTELE